MVAKEKSIMHHHGRLKDKVAVITGAASGIGKATAELFARQGARVCLADIQEGPLSEVTGSINGLGADAICRATDVSREEEVKELIELAHKKYERLDILVNNAGITGQMKDLFNDDPRDWKQVYDVNVLSAVMAVKFAAPLMQEQKEGAVINVSSVAGVRAGAGSNAYSASKAALISFTRTAACDLGAFNVRVNAVCPGLIETGMTQPIFDYARASGKGEKLGSRCELKRYGLPLEVAHAILFLASSEASFITGQVLPVDGGNTASLNLPGMKY